MSAKYHPRSAIVTSNARAKAAGAVDDAPFQWTDDMVGLLIASISYVAEDCAAEDARRRRRRSTVALPTKREWKLVSQLMCEKGCPVSPQQCEDKFNDLNRHRLHDILSRGIPCQVIGYPALLEPAPRVAAEAKKVLGSKYLFYREMRACRGRNDEGDVDESGVEEEGRDGLWADIKSKSCAEQLVWFREQALRLREKRVAIKAHVLEMKKQRFRLEMLCDKKDREMEWLRLANERLMLANKRMMMLMRKRELELDHRRFEELRVNGGHMFSDGQGIRERST